MCPITFYDFDFSFLKIILKSTLHGLLQGKVDPLFSIILKQNGYSFPFLGNPCIPIFKLCLIVMYLMQCTLFTRDYCVY